MTVRPRRALAAGLLGLLLVSGAAACSDSQDDSGAVTNLDEVGPQLAKLRSEVAALRQEVQSLREELAVGGTSTTTSPTQPLR
jgi:outer membrane murein-binding lipoprotein Lpp